MFEFAAAFAFSSRTDCRERVEAMLDAARTDRCDGVQTASSAHGCAAIKRWHVVRRDERAIPVWDQDQQLLVFGDVRLYNRPELAIALDLDLDAGPAISDLEVAFHAYRAWGRQAPKHLVGDFAFMVWDEKARELFAARDQTGVRPMHYMATTDGLVIASRVISLLPFLDRPYERVNPASISSFFFPWARRPGEVYFRDVRLLPAGHTLLATERGCREDRYWVPPLAATPARSYEENCAELLALFRRAVRDRLESDVPIIAHSSGGFDSSTILMAAEEAYREPGRRPPLIMASGLTIGFPCDDSRYMEAVARRVPFEWVTWNVVNSVAEAEAPATTLAEPGLRRGLGGGRKRDLEIAKERWAGVLLEGIGGDELLYADGVFMDMFRAGRWSEILSETQALVKPLARALKIVGEIALGALPPATAFSLKHQVLRRHRKSPMWLGSVLEEHYSASIPRVEHGAASWPSHTMLSLWSRLNGPNVTWVLNKAIAYGSEEGIEVRTPYADVRLIEHILSIPWDQRVPRGHLRRTGRDALGPLLPPAFHDRVDQMSFSQIWAINDQRQEAFIRKMIQTGPWLSAPYVRRNEARIILNKAASFSSDGPWTLLLKFACLESWLRGLSCYNPCREVATCQRD